MSNSIRRTALLAAVALPAALGAQSASAALITEWNYQIDSAFTSFTDTIGTGSGVVGSAPNAEFGAPSQLSWGVPSPAGGDQSSIGIQSDVDGTGLETNDLAGVPGATFTHDNNVITAASSILDTFQLSTQLMLTQAAPPGPGEEDVGPITFNGFFNETRNAPTCVEGSVSVCDDIFVLGNAGNIGALGAGQSFVIEDYQYTVFLDIDGVDTLTDAQCDAADADPGCVGFLTREDTLNRFTSTVTIEATEIPTPGVLALLGVGLLGLGFARRGRQG